MSTPSEDLTQTSASSPRSVAPARPSTTYRPLAAPKPLAPAPSTGPFPSMITTREWIVPPRPKPGRKPATDTPPTKRKAQNRAAQRAFRERRAAKVGELEEHIRKIEDEDEREQTELRSQIDKLEAEVEHYREELLAWHHKCQGLEKSLEEEMGEKRALEEEIAALRDGRNRGTDAVSLPSRSNNQKRTTDQKKQSQSSGGTPDPEEIAMGCGACTSSSRCECIEQALGISGMDIPDDSAPKRPLSPQTIMMTKRSRPSVENPNPNAEELEIDFTTRFSAKPVCAANRLPTGAQPTATSMSTYPDPCGFCQDGTACLCAEMAAETAQSDNMAPTFSQFTPPPCDGDVVAEQSSPPQATATHPTPWTTNPCANGPGTCDQCKADPQSTLFCKTLAAARTSSTTATSTIPSSTAQPCTNASTPGGCCRIQPQPVRNTGLTLTCADAYTTLSRHPNYAEASDDLASWLPSLWTRAVPRGQEGRPAMEVDAACVMSVLKFFDRRFSTRVDG